VHAGQRQDSYQYAPPYNHSRNLREAGNKWEGHFVARRAGGGKGAARGIDDRRMMILRNGALGRPISVSNQQPSEARQPIQCFSSQNGQSQISNHQSKHAALE
jgi:hypothetical protein